MKRLLLPIFVMFCLSLFAVKVYAITIDADSYILIESKSGVVLEEKDINKKLYPASTTKMMTAIVALENAKLDKVCIASQEAVRDIGRGGMNIGIIPGEEIKLEDLLNALLIQSANETANIIAENVAPSRAKFVEMMNKRAKELGATNTTFKNPCGKDTEIEDDGHNTTANDLALIAKHAMTIPKFREIVQKEKYTMPTTNKHPKPVNIATTNKMLSYAKYKSEFYDKITGVKTGFTNKAGSALVSSAVNKDGLELITVILGVRSPNPDKIRDVTKKLLEQGFKNYEMESLVVKDSKITTLSVDNAESGATIDGIASKDLAFIVPKKNATQINQKWNINKVEKILKPLAAPIKAGDKVGSVEYSLNGKIIGTVDIISSKSVDKLIIPERTMFVNVVKGVVSGVLLLILLFFILRIVIKIINKRRVTYLMPKTGEFMPNAWTSENDRYKHKERKIDSIKVNERESAREYAREFAKEYKMINEREKYENDRRYS